MACVLEAGEGGGDLERLAQRIDALGGVFAVAKPVDAADLVVGEAADKEDAQRVCRLKAADAKASRGTKFMQSSRGLWAT